MHLDLPHPGKEDAGILRVHRKPRASCIFVGKQNSFPVLAAIRGAVDTTLLLRSRHPTQGTDKNNVGVLGMNDDTADTAGFAQTDVGPCFTSIHDL